MYETPQTADLSISAPPLLPSSLPTPDASIESALKSLDAALHTRDACTHSHCKRVIHYSLALGRLMGLSSQELQTLERGVFLHDIGKIHMPDSILMKPGQLSDSERAVMQQHSSIGYEIVRFYPLLADAAEIVLTHHERYDGTGYPFGMAGEDIPLSARICTIADTLDAITSHRPYRTPMSFPDAWTYICSESGTHFDPNIIDLFSAIPPEEWQGIQQRATLTSLLLAA